MVITFSDNPCGCGWIVGQQISSVNLHEHPRYGLISTSDSRDNNNFRKSRLGKKKHDEVSWVDAIWIGLFQILALFPGVSRSGSTIAGGITRNLTRTAAARFSFLMAFPIMFSAGIYSAIDLLGVENLTAFLPSLGLGLLTSAITGYYSIRWLLRYLTNHTMYVFAIYLIGLSFFTLITLYFPR